MYMCICECAPGDGADTRFLAIRWFVLDVVSFQASSKNATPVMSAWSSPLWCLGPFGRRLVVFSAIGPL